MLYQRSSSQTTFLAENFSWNECWNECWNCKQTRPELIGILSNVTYAKRLAKKELVLCLPRRTVIDAKPCKLHKKK